MKIGLLRRTRRLPMEGGRFDRCVVVRVGGGDERAKV